MANQAITLTINLILVDFFVARPREQKPTEISMKFRSLIGHPELTLSSFQTLIAQREIVFRSETKL